MTRTPSNSTHRIDALFAAERDRMTDVLRCFEGATERGQPAGIARVVFSIASEDKDKTLVTLDKLAAATGQVN